MNENISVSEMLNFKLDVSNYSKGMYFVILKNETGTMILKFIKH
ncbi:MAG: T9SS type A sorting domain-containing protein [Bacteroidales bacterium]|nr:T9SS type A sorting domain-containing protein [Bacteroidales bacterium]